LYIAGGGADDTDAARRAQETANTATRRLAIDARAADGTNTARSGHLEAELDRDGALEEVEPLWIDAWIGE
jgi:hypothetical protein